MPPTRFLRFIKESDRVCGLHFQLAIYRQISATFWLFAEKRPLILAGFALSERQRARLRLQGYPP
jgi:hypothetical protein